MPTRSLPPRPHLGQLKRQASELHHEHRARRPSSAARIAAHHPRCKGQSVHAILETPLALADAQLVIAREYGFESWTKLKQHVELADAVASFHPHPRFGEALEAMDAGDTDRLRHRLAADPALVDARTNLEPPFDYFTGATLLHHVAGNPDRGRLDGTRPPLPANSADVARALLEAGADVHARTLGPNGGDTMGLVLTSKQASDANVVGPLIDVLLEYGARLDLTSDGCLDASLANHAPRAAEKVIALGARPDVLAAAALGRLDLLQTFFDGDGRLTSRPRRGNKEMTERDAVGLALLYAYVREERAVVDFLLEKDGNWDMIGVHNGAALHRAAFAGDLEMVKRLVAKGASTVNRDNPFNSTPLAWADHNNQTGVVRWLRGNCAVDLHDAASFDFREHITARLREDPGSVNQRMDHWDIPQTTALHWAAAMGHEEAATLLLEGGADPNIVAGNGMTAMDLADANGAAGVSALLERHGGTRTSGRRAASAAAPGGLEPFEALAAADRQRPCNADHEVRQPSTTDDLGLHNRRSIRLAGRDYSADGSYFVTVCANRRLHLFGDIVDGKMNLNALGSAVVETWLWLPSQYSYVSLDEWCVMPNHLHGILTLTGRGGSRTAPTNDVRRKPLGRLIGAFKTVSTKHINRLRNTPAGVLWQRNFWERVIRDDAEMDRIRAYIRNNPADWAKDELNVSRRCPQPSFRNGCSRWRRRSLRTGSPDPSGSSSASSTASG